MLALDPCPLFLHLTLCGKSDGACEMNKSRSYFRLLEALKEPGCPICKLVLEDSRTYLEHLMYESVLDVPTRLILMESFGFCGWHARQIPALPAICAPAVGFSIFASDLLRKMEYVSRALIKKYGAEKKWKTWLRKNPRKLLSLIKRSACPVCVHVKQSESYHLDELMDSFTGDFLHAYKASPGLCLPHFFTLEAMHSSHANFRLVFQVQMAKVEALRNAVEEFIRKQDFRLRDQITLEEARCWKKALETLTGAPGVFGNEMHQDILRPTRKGSVPAESTLLTRLPAKSTTMQDLLDEFRISTQVTFYLKEPLPPELFDALKELAEDSPSPVIEAVVEGLNDVDYLYRLHSAGFSIFYGVSLPPVTIILLDSKRGFVLEESRGDSKWRVRKLKNPEDLYLSLVWHKFGIAVFISGSVTEIDTTSGLFCVTNNKREQWCRFRTPTTNKLPEIGTTVKLFGWEKWNTHVVEVLHVNG